MITIDSVSNGYITIQATNQQASAIIQSSSLIVNATAETGIQSVNGQASVLMQASSLVVGPTAEASIIVSN